ncbi:Rpn family recombination-promoting nuclease/putative transposase [Desulfosporosinus youngiae]|uniref:Putative transposase n=1 Tax=Desulfosporosinus youngiae DSM 17734 TaxID=768710 RepID=H5XW42_9FIRM|nr:Rpn family recombination-promoting nuclease/putative transposase [Desulfosporosinus youngiae]EHQ90635.1 putative transposase [Desulfosporosinus youngiae DSM 17734]
MNLIHKPHDKFFKETLSDLRTTQDFLQNYLPQELLEFMDLETVTLHKDSFIEKELEETFSDLLFQTKINHKDSYLYLLFEHKSYPSPKVALQLLKYMLNIWELKTAGRPAAKLPVIIPLVVYHGQARWNSPLKLSGLIEDYEQLPLAVANCLPDFSYLLYNISAYSNADIKGSMKLQIFLKLLRDIFEEDYGVFLKTLQESLRALDELEKQDKESEYFETFIRYIMNARNDLEFQTVYDLAKEISLERSEVLMTIAEKLITEGMERGLEEGMEKGKLEVAENLLRLGMEVDMIIKATGLAEDEIRKLMN